MPSRLRLRLHHSKNALKYIVESQQSGFRIATRYTFSKDWEEMRQKIDWMTIASMPEYVNRLVSNKPIDMGGHWAEYARDNYLTPLANKLDRKLGMVSLACGNGHIEESLINDFHWPVDNLLGLEFDDEMRSAAADRFSSISSCSSRFEFFDFNESYFPDGKFDIIFACHSLHHATKVEELLEKMNQMIKPDGLIIGIDFFGPTRFQIEYEVLPYLEELFSYLTPELRRNLKTLNLAVQEKFTFDTIEQVKAADISESVRSSDLRTLLFSTFPVVDIKPMGGTLLRWLFRHRAGNINPHNPNHISIVHLLQFIERELIASGRIKSDDLFFVLSKSDRLPG